MIPTQRNDALIAVVRLKRLLANVGRWTISLWQEPVQFISDAVAVIWQGCRPITWRRSVRAELMRQCYQVGAQALPFILVAGIFVGFGLVAQAFHWLSVFGSTKLFGGFLSATLVREVAPVLVGLIVIGRSGSTLLVELGTMKTEGQVHMLDAQGLDPFLYLVVPRVVAFSICMFALTTAFVAVALLAGFFSGVLIGITQFNFFDFLNRAIGSMGLQTYLLFTVKTVSIGFVVALISCKIALSISGVSARVLGIMPRGFARSALATLIISIVLTILFSSW
ncbi:MAG: ABC transporter permease [Deltaproteobacteria bacterium]|jgi:phospholipid/cholesterol/gamma-HCH transport system permease protein|nr:ABC transporter permease [Deltaproteobacteria bacterium]MBW2467870.1 ABC transporter permease [Deltaproteobacteria bacterium]MBW2486737.1 ABC transporter permease [Deltaproteobacteria bacterium]MBW2518166.1 ABC transporter permease [Deltaproteobacteria bacterium]